MNLVTAPGGSWPLVHGERAALAADLASLDGEQWATPSLCAGLTVREMLAHLTAGARLNSVRWLAGVIRCRFDFEKQVAMRLAEQLGASPAETLERFRSTVTSTTKPPLPVLAMLGEAVVHAADIRRPLGIRPHPGPHHGDDRTRRVLRRSGGRGSRHPAGTLRRPVTPARGCRARN
jgi:uncharacterized protein (TIGR03083 family)